MTETSNADSPRMARSRSDRLIGYIGDGSPRLQEHTPPDCGVYIQPQMQSHIHFEGDI